MRFLLIARPDDASEQPADASCDQRDENFSLDLCRAFAAYNEELVRAGVLVAAEGVNPQAPVMRVGRRGNRRTVIDGPFIESKELAGGFYLIDVATRDEAVEWAMRCPGPKTLEIRQLTELSDLPSEMQDLMRETAPGWTSDRWGVGAKT